MSPADKGPAKPGDTGPESDYSRPTVRGKGLRTGYTTGACATAATKAAITALLTGNPVEKVTIHLPMGSDVEFTLNRCEWTDRTTGSEKVLCSVIKDGGDDPDATHGAEICATVWFDSGATTEAGVTIKGGVGVGIVTFPGTGITVGEPAVTRVPRRMITQTALETAKANGLEQGKEIIVELSVPTGEDVALKTTNARLGVIGGISILGSTGVVQPYSTAAWRASVNLAVDVAGTNNIKHMVLATGLASEEFAKNHLDLPDTAYVGIGIFSGAALKRCVARGFKRATHVGMVGKFSKMAMGYFVTHVAGNKVDTTFLAGLAGQCGASKKLQKEMAATNSGRHFGEIALANDQLALFTLMSQMVCDESHKLLGEDADKLIVDAMCFDFDGTLLGYASTSPEGIPMVKDLPEIRRSLGLPDDAFEQRRPDKGQITKREVRAVSLYSLGLRQDSVVWDIGAGTGSVSVESALIANHGQVFSIESDTDSLPLLEANVAKWGSENISIVSGEAPGILEDLPNPDSVFVGGSGGNLSAILNYVFSRLNPNGTIVVNLAVLERTHEAYALLKGLRMEVELTQVTSSRGKEMPDGAVRLESLNPVFIVSGRLGN